MRYMQLGVELPAICDIGLFVNPPVKIMEGVEEIFVPLGGENPESLFAKKLDGTILQWADSTPVLADISNGTMENHKRPGSGKGISQAGTGGISKFKKSGCCAALFYMG
jgi:hypothetical protein